MDFWDLTKLLFRRWYIALPLLALTMGATGLTMSSVKPDYTATSYVQLIPPSAASTTANVAELRNPWLQLGLGTLNTAVTYATLDSAYLSSLKAQGLSDNVTITDGYPAPIATIVVIAPTMNAARDTTDRVVQHFSGIVKSLQDDYGVQSAGMIVTRRLDQGQNLQKNGGKVKRALVAVAGAGILLSAGLTIGIDATIRRRRRKKATLVAAGLAADPAGPLAVAETVGAAPINGSANGVQVKTVPSDKSVASDRTVTSEVLVNTDMTIVLPRVGQEGQPTTGDGGIKWH